MGGWANKITYLIPPCWEHLTLLLTSYRCKPDFLNVKRRPEKLASNWMRFSLNWNAFPGRIPFYMTRGVVDLCPYNDQSPPPEQMNIGWLPSVRKKSELSHLTNYPDAIWEPWGRRDWMRDHLYCSCSFYSLSVKIRHIIYASAPFQSRLCIDYANSVLITPLKDYNGCKTWKRISRAFIRVKIEDIGYVLT